MYIYIYILSVAEEHLKQAVTEATILTDDEFLTRAREREVLLTLLLSLGDIVTNSITIITITPIIIIIMTIIILLLIISLRAAGPQCYIYYCHPPGVPHEVLDGSTMITGLMWQDRPY